MEPKFFRSQAECREWFEKNHDIAGEAIPGAVLPADSHSLGHECKKGCYPEQQTAFINNRFRKSGEDQTATEK